MTSREEEQPAFSLGVVEETRTEPAEGRAQFEHEVLTHLDGLYAFAMKLARSRHDAEDLVSDTVLRALDRWEQYQPETNIRAWLFTILYHFFINRRRQIDRREVPLEDEDGRSRFEPATETDSEESFYASFVDEEISRAIESLPEEYRAPLVLSDVHDFRYREIADILGVPEGTVKSRLFRGRRIPRRKLMRYAIENGYVKARAA